MADITSDQARVGAFSNEAVRGMSELTWKYIDSIKSYLSSWDEEISALVPNDMQWIFKTVEILNFTMVIIKIYMN